MTKVCSTWVPTSLTPLQKHERVEVCKELLVGYEEEANDFISRIITGGGPYFYYYQPESKQSSKQWKQADSPQPPTKLKQEKSESKDFSGIIVVSF